MRPDSEVVAGGDAATGQRSHKGSSAGVIYYWLAKNENFAAKTHSDRCARRLIPFPRDKFQAAGAFRPDAVLIRGRDRADESAPKRDIAGIIHHRGTQAIKPRADGYVRGLIAGPCH